MPFSPNSEVMMLALSQARWPGMSSDAREAIAVSLHGIDRYRQRVATRALGAVLAFAGVVSGGLPRSPTGCSSARAW